MRKAIDLTGQVFGNWTVLRRADITKNGGATWLCRCVCGTERVVRSGGLRSGISKGCGCVRLNNMKKRNITHGETGTRLYRIWKGIIQRTTNENSDSFKDYGGRGIGVCEEWEKSFEAFKAWALKNGYQENLTIGRIDNNKGYSPENCRWETRETQQRNTRKTHFITFQGKTQCITDWAKETGINRHTLYVRINQLGWDIERALTTK